MKKEYFLVVSLLIFRLCPIVSSSCIDIKECPAALKYLDDLQSNNIHSSSIQILKEAYCGTTDTVTKVFCEKIPPCYEPSDKNFCVEAKDCCVLLRLINLNVTQNPEVKKQLRESSCDATNSGTIKIKCTSLLDTEELVFKQASNDRDACVTPSGLKGRCIPWELCPTFKDKPVSKNYLHYFERSICDPKDRKVCCGLRENVDHICGVDNNVDRKISGGTATSVNEFPWVVLLIYTKPDIVCGGSLINSQFVLTAAHCVRNDLRKVRIAGNFRDNIAEYRIVARKIHQNYNPRPIRYDIALLKIEPVAYSDSISWICLPRKSNNLPRRYLIVGNGFTENDTLSKLQLKASVPHAETSRCEKLYRHYLDSYYDFIICAGGEPGVDACPGDSGGPLMSNEDSSVWNLYGIVSGGTVTCSDGSPGFYTRVDKFLNWINAQMKEML